LGTKTILPPEQELIALLQSRNEKGLRVLYDHYAAALYGVIFRIINDKETSEDLLQETFVKIWNNAAQYDPSKGRLYTWMLNIARNNAIDRTRSKDFRASGQVRSIEDFVYTVEKQHNHSTAVDHIGLQKVIDTLKPEQRELIDLLYFGGYTQSEVSDKLGIPLGTVKTRIKAAMVKLRELLQ
jgi:RNA polymerase sigma-70 factor, ECF subfamily